MAFTWQVSIRISRNGETVWYHTVSEHKNMKLKIFVRLTAFIWKAAIDIGSPISSEFKNIKILRICLSFSEQKNMEKKYRCTLFVD